jgi:hypothetical protein
LLLGLRLQDREPCLFVGWLDVGDESPLEPRSQPGLKALDRARWPVACHDNLAAVGVQVVERVEELFLRAALVGQELDVIHHQQLDRPVAPPELIAASLGDGRHEVVHELLGGNVQRVASGLSRAQGDRLEEVGLAQAWAAVDE